MRVSSGIPNQVSEFGGTAKATQPRAAVPSRGGAANVPGQIGLSRNSRGPVKLDARAQAGKHSRPVSSKDRLHQELALVDQSQSCPRQGERDAIDPQAFAMVCHTTSRIHEGNGGSSGK
jgi:hypothetical protein